MDLKRDISNALLVSRRNGKECNTILLGRKQKEHIDQLNDIIDVFETEGGRGVVWAKGIVYVDEDYFCKAVYVPEEI